MLALVELEEDDVIIFVGGDSAGKDKGVGLCTGGDKVGDPLDVVQTEDCGSVLLSTSFDGG